MKNKVITFILILITSNVFSQDVQFKDLIKLLDFDKTEINLFFAAKNYRAKEKQKQDCENLLYLLEVGEETNYYSISLCPKEKRIEFYSNSKKYIDNLKFLTIQNGYQKIDYDIKSSPTSKNIVDYYNNGLYEIYFISSKDQSNNTTMISFVKEHLPTDRTIEIPENNQEMNEAIQNAKSTTEDFFNAYKDDRSKYKNFMLKKAFYSNLGPEYIWLVDIKYNAIKKNYTGRISAQPLYSKIIKANDIVEINNNEISDWIFQDENNFVYGGYTLKVLRNKMSEDEKQIFDKENNLKFK